MVACSPLRLLCESVVWCLFALLSSTRVPKRRINSIKERETEEEWCVKMCVAAAAVSNPFRCWVSVYFFPLIHSFSVCMHVFYVDTGGGDEAADVACRMLMLLLMSYPHFYTVSTMHKSRPMPPLSMRYCVCLLSPFLRNVSFSLAN